MPETTTTRSNPLIDPLLQAWHGEVALYLFLGGLCAGLLVVAGALALLKPGERPSRALALLPWWSLVLISLGMLCLFLDLANRFNAWRFYLILRPQTPMSWGAWILVLVYPVAALFSWTRTPLELRRRWLQRWPRLGAVEAFAEPRREALAWAAIVAGTLLGVYTGVLVGTFNARPFWNSAVLGPLFLVSGLSTGAAFLLLFRLADGERRQLGRLDMGLITVELALIALWLVGLATAGEAGLQAARLVLGGPWTAAFWTLVVGLGLLVPLLGEWIEHRRGEVPGRALAILVLVGGLSLRWILLYAGQYSRWVSDALATIQ
jgi:protein NrfD